MFTTSAGIAQGYPSKPIRVIVPFAPGGGTDIIARLLAPGLSRALRQQVVVDNRPGANTILGAEAVAKAAPDGYTLLLALTGTLAINPSLYPRLAYDPTKDFDSISLLAGSPNILVVHPSLPARNVRELINLAKKRPGELSFASSGAGGVPHIAGELLNRRAGINMLHIAYKGAAPALTDVLGGHITIMFSALPPVLPQIKSGRLRALGVTSKSRTSLAPELPAISESGLPDFDLSTWFGILAPVGTPRAVIERLNREIGLLLKQPELVTQFAVQGLEPLQSSPEEFDRYIRAEIARWAEIIKTTGARAD